MSISMAGHISLAMKEVIPRLNSYTDPVFANAKNGIPDLIASSVIIKLKTKIFFITASHKDIF